MSVIEDSRKVLQDFIAPELRAIDARLTAIEKRMDGMDRRFDETDRRFERMERRLDHMEQSILAEIRSLKNIHDLELRMARLEAASLSNRAIQATKPESEAA